MIEKWWLSLRRGVWVGCFLFLMTAVNGMAGEGTAGSEFLNLVPGARSAGMADCFHAAGDDAESLFANPAGILGLINPQIGASHMAWWEGIIYDALWGVQPLGKAGSFGLALALFNVLPFDSTEDGSQGTEQARSFLATVGYAYPVDRSLALGGQIKVSQTQLSDVSSWSLALDAGVQHAWLNDQLIMAASIQNIGFQSAFLESSDDLPVNFIASAAYQFWPDDPYRLLVTTDVKMPFQSSPTFAAGAEAWLENLIALRAGLKTNRDAGDWLTVGAGMKWRNIHVDYALTPLGVLGTTHRVSLVYDFGSQRRLARPRLSVAIVTKQFIYPDGEAGYSVHFIPAAHVAAGITRWELIIRNKSGRMIKEFSGTKMMALEIVWDGLDALGKRTDAETTFYYQMSILDRQGYRADVTGEILPISITKLPKLKAMPRDIFAGQVSFNPKNVKNMQEWSVNIVGADGRILKKYGGKGAIPKDFSWDGTDENNHQVAVKTGYHFILKIRDKQNNEMLSKASLVVIDAGTKAYVQSGEPLPEEIPFHFEPTDLKVKRWVFDIVDRKTKKVIRSYEGTSPLPDDLIWDAKDEKGRRVRSDCTYSYVLRMQDQIGNVWQQAADIKRTDVIILEKDSAGIRLKVEQILFDFNQAELKPSMFMKLRKISDFVNGNPEADMRIYIEGHTDEVGTEAYSMELSIKRANMVMRYLVEDEKLPSSIMEMKGYGKTKPYAQGAVSGRQAQNRRVEITLVIQEK